jgi:hypothetical protein
VRNRECCYGCEGIIAFYLSRNRKYDPDGDLRIGSCTVPSCRPGGSIKVAKRLDVPDGIASGKWYIIGVMQSGSGIMQTNSANDVAVRKTRIR